MKRNELGEILNKPVSDEEKKKNRDRLEKNPLFNEVAENYNVNDYWSLREAAYYFRRTNQKKLENFTRRLYKTLAYGYYSQ